jgi:hypothetical protein
VFTGFRWENRFPLMRSYFINPVLYVEFEDINGADRSFLEMVNHDSVADLYTVMPRRGPRRNKPWS